ncbi:unnamed protein product [Cuscuta campestris]|uniref:F-box domain-containing protein n=1 Tax=Cuscuta campestris TaxID=132261 RepID=A0A484KHZ7_9ASTE|nr:unnamed protein product [Cuscuta campestris]
MDADARSLPEDIIRNILSRIPVRSLLRFQCVSRQWRALIKTPSFVAEHLRRQSPCLLFTWEQDRALNLRLLDFENMQLRPVQGPHLVSGLDYGGIMGSTNGLPCFRISRDTFYVWNPAIGELRMTPEVIEPDNGYPNVGFGFSPVINDYKIVVIWESKFPFFVQVYSLTSGSWKEVECEIIKGISLLRFISPGVTTNGTIFWLAMNDDGDVIVSFDVALELFTFIPVPVVEEDSRCSRLVVYENKLALFIKRLLSENLEYTDFWVMEERDVVASSSSYGERWSWTKKFNTTLPRNMSPLMIWKNEIVCRVDNKHVAEWSRWKEEKSRIYLFNLKTGESDNMLVIHESYMCIDYVESLVPVGGNKLSVIFM